MVSNLLAVVPVADFVPALDWYERLLGRPPDVFPMADERLAEWQLTFSAGIQVVDDPGRAGTAQVTLAVDDLDKALAALSARGLPVGDAGGGELPGGGTVRAVIVTDPEGNVLTLAGVTLP
jgi:hypothetical protein